MCVVWCPGVWQHGSFNGGSARLSTRCCGAATGPEGLLDGRQIDWRRSVLASTSMSVVLVTLFSRAQHVAKYRYVSCAKQGA
jgi:hypothetical protein